MPVAQWSPLVQITGRCSWFGGPTDVDGVGPDEGLSFIRDISQAPHLFLKTQPLHTTGLARRLNPLVNYIACRWNFQETPMWVLLRHPAMVRAHKTNRVILAYPADWGPAEETGRVCDLSLGAMRRLGIQTDDIVDVAFPATEGLLA